MRARSIWVAAVLLGLSVASAQPLPVPTVSKTVGTGGGCATTSSITVVSGTQVNYCYQITNPLNTTLFFALVDDRLGSVANGSVGGLGTDNEFANATINNGTVTNIATWFYSNENTSISGNVTASATVAATAAPLVSVPTLSDLGLIALGMGILAVSFGVLRRAG